MSTDGLIISQAEQAVVAAFGQLASEGIQASVDSVPKRAKDLLYKSGAGTFGKDEVAGAVNRTIREWRTAGKIIGPIEGGRDWILKVSVAASDRVFVVHGHDEGARESVARFLEKVGLRPIVLFEEPDRGRTIIEKFEEHATEATFAVILLTPDDVGGKASASGVPMPRARQNVIFELGFFVGRLGRRKVCVLRKGTVEGFSDFDGVLYKQMDAGGGWKAALARELEEAGLPINMANVARA